MAASNELLAQLKFRDPVKARAIADALQREVDAIGRDEITVMHVCGSHEQSIARFGIRAVLPRQLSLIMGPGCPVCVTDAPEIDEAVALTRQGCRVLTYGDMLKVPGTVKSLGDAQADGGKVDIVYGVEQVIEIANQHPDEEVVFFSSGFETTAVATAAAILRGLPKNLSVLSSHKYVPPAMEIVAGMPGSKVEAFLAAGHAAIITGCDCFRPMAQKYKLPIVVTGFEPLDVLAAILKTVEMIRRKEYDVANCYPRCVTGPGNLPAQKMLWKVFEPVGGQWRGIAVIPDGNLRLKEEFAAVDSRRRFQIDLTALWNYAPRKLAEQCICGEIMAGFKSPRDCQLFGKECLPESPVGACMVSSEGTCKIWHQYGGVPDLREVS